MAHLSQRWGSRSAPFIGSNFGSGRGLKRKGRVTASRCTLEPANSSGDPYHRTNVATDDENVPKYLVETTEQRNRPRRIAHEEERDATPRIKTPVTLSKPKKKRDTNGQITTGKETTVIEMHMGPETGTTNTTITRARYKLERSHVRQRLMMTSK